MAPLDQTTFDACGQTVAVLLINHAAMQRQKRVDAMIYHAPSISFDDIDYLPIHAIRFEVKVGFVLSEPTNRSGLAPLSYKCVPTEIPSSESSPIRTAASSMSVGSASSIHLPRDFHL